MNNLGTPKMSREERRYSVPNGPQHPMPPVASEDLHAWSIYRQNLNSDFTDSALGSSDKSPLPYGNFQLRDTTVQSILNHPRYGPKSPLGSNMYTYLKFGLPRVFPPNANGTVKGAPNNASRMGTQNRGRVNRGYRDSQIGANAGSSGYDSSDNETQRSRLPANLRKFRSESDFRQILPSRPGSVQAHGHGNIPLAALRQANSRASIAGPVHHHNSQHQQQHHHHQQYSQLNGHGGGGRHYGNRSHSEADLLGGGGGLAPHHDSMYDYDSSRIYAPSRARSEQHLLAAAAASSSSRRHSAIGLVYPNIQIHGLDVSPSVRNVSLQAKAGDLFAVMATSEREGTILMETIAGLRDRAGGDLMVNGQHMTQHGMRDLCGYVPAPQNAALDPRMSVQNTLSFHAALRGPMDKSDLLERIDILIEDLGLTAVRTASVARLTHSEKQRLSVACQLLTQASILVLDQVTTNMDIFDTFFLVEYLRQWCTGRIVIMTLQPPTFEILSMCSGVLLLSGGRTIFSGSRSDLPRHMSSLGYPCPPFKNPADYYLDLVTLDDLSAAAMLESSARIESLANSWDHIMSNEIPVGAPPANLPKYTKRAGFTKQFGALCKRYIVYKQPSSLLTWICKLIVAAVMSLLIGCVFWDVPLSDPQLLLNDRFGYHHTILAVAPLPILMMTIRDLDLDRKHAEKEISLKLYSRSLYIILQNVLTLLPSLCIWLAYLLPAYSMAGLYSYSKSGGSSDTRIYVYMGFMLVYMTALQTIALFFTHLFRCTTTSVVWTGMLQFLLSCVGGFVLHVRNIPEHVRWLSVLSPERWLFPVLAFDEYSLEALSSISELQLCRNKQVQHQEIIVSTTCPPANGTAVLSDHLLLAQDHVLDSSDIEGSTLVALLVTAVLFFVLTFVAFVGNTRKWFRSNRKSSRLQ